MLTFGSASADRLPPQDVSTSLTRHNAACHEAPVQQCAVSTPEYQDIE